MTDRGQLDLISLLVNLFLSPFLVHHSQAFYPLSRSLYLLSSLSLSSALPLPLTPSLAFLLLLFRHLSPFFVLPRSVTSFFRHSLSLLLSPPSLSITLSVSQSFFHLFGRTLSCFSSARHPGPFISFLLFFSRSFDNFLSSFNFVILRFCQNLFDLAVTPSLHPPLCLSLSVFFSLYKVGQSQGVVYVLAHVDVVLSLPPKCFGNTRDLLSCQCN